MSAVALPALIQRFFTDRLCVQMEASRHTVAGYRDTFRLLLRYASARHGKPPVKLTIEDIDADLVADFLVHTETARGNGARSCNTRLAAIRSFFRYVAMTDPTWLLHCQRILAMPNKRYVKRTVTFLDADEMAALLATPDRTTWAGRRDHALLLLAVQTGLRASELVGLQCGDVVFGSGAHIRCMGKGRKERATPLRRETAELLAAWIGNKDGSSTGVPEHRRQAGHAAYASPQHGDGPASPRRRPSGDRALAWARERRDHPDLHPRRHADEGEGARSCRRWANAAGPLPARRPTSRVLGRALIMPNSRMADARQTDLQRRPCGIIRIAALCPSS
jgi:site-specific recombinase XerD